jgi:hypothetical protein
MTYHSPKYTIGAYIAIAGMIVVFLAAAVGMVRSIWELAMYFGG